MEKSKVKFLERYSVIAASVIPLVFILKYNRLELWNYHCLLYTSKIGMTVHAVKSTEIGMKVGNKASIVGSDSFYLGKCIFFQFYCFFRFGFKSCLKIQ